MIEQWHIDRGRIMFLPLILTDILANSTNDLSHELKWFCLVYILQIKASDRSFSNRSITFCTLLQLICPKFCPKSQVQRYRCMHNLVKKNIFSSYIGYRNNYMDIVIWILGITNFTHCTISAICPDVIRNMHFTGKKNSKWIQTDIKNL